MRLKIVSYHCLVILDHFTLRISEQCYFWTILHIRMLRNNRIALSRMIYYTIWLPSFTHFITHELQLHSQIILPLLCYVDDLLHTDATDPCQELPRLVLPTILCDHINTHLDMQPWLPRIKKSSSSISLMLTGEIVLFSDSNGGIILAVPFWND